MAPTAAIDDYVHVFPSHLRMDSLLAGAVLSYYHAFHENELRTWVRRYGAWLQPVSISLLAPIAFLDQTHPFIYTLGFSMTAWSFALLLAAIVYPSKTAKHPNGSIARALAKLGQASYGFYLWHGLVLFAADRILPSLAHSGFPISAGSLFVATFGATTAIAFLTTWLIEIPLLRLRDRWFPSGARAHAGSSNEPSAMPAVAA
jgi:peptidoglycan/LPS O-acetylase OafA/YrhL